MPNEPVPHPEHPYSWSVAHYVPRLVIRRGQTAQMIVMIGDKRAQLIGKHAATRDGLIQGVHLATVPPDHVFDPSPEAAPNMDPYYWPSRARVEIKAGQTVTIEVCIGPRSDVDVPAGPIIVEAAAHADCLIAGFGLQVADLDAERRREVDRIAQEAQA